MAAEGSPALRRLAGFTVAGSAGDADSRGPALAAVRRHERRHAAIEVSEGNHDIAVGLNYGIAADTEITAAR